MSKTDNLSEIFDLPVERNSENLPSTEIKQMPNEIKESLKHNKTELNEIYRGAKKLLMNLINEADDIGRARDIEVLTEFMKETTNILKKVRDIDKDIIEVDNGGGNGDGDTVNKVNNFIFSGDTRDIIELVKTLKKKKENDGVINVDAKVEKVKE